ncbi:MAG TPA: hypothetical protein VGP06_02675 [Janthinobacterium sp.]|jgi:hypothetical protein|nr:hypothetical protein [Janthinobacterium sp.]
MKKKVSSQLQISGKKNTQNTPGTLSKAQKQFNKLIKDLQKQRILLRAWQDVELAYQRLYEAQYQPLLARFDEVRIELLQLFDRKYHEKALSKADRANLAHFISTVAAEVLGHGARAKVKELFNKYSGKDFDTLVDREKKEIKALIKEVFGIEIDDGIDLDDRQAVLKAAAEQVRKMQEHEEQGRSPFPGRKKSAGEPGKEAQREAQPETRREEGEKNVSQSLREVYRKLASALHPDRALDPQERVRKTGLMQRVNAAYAAQNLLELLELQLETEQIDQASAGAIDEQRLKHYNQILKEQSAELALEAEHVELVFRMRYGIDEGQPGQPAALLDGLRGDILDLQESIASLEEDLRQFQETKKLKAFLKDYRMTSTTMTDLDFFNDLFGDPDWGGRR